MNTETASQVNIEKALSIGGWMSERELTWLASQAKNCKTIVEFGSYHGRSTRALADNSPKDTVIWAVDPWNGEYLTDSGVVVPDVNSYCLPIFKTNLEDHIASGKVIPVRRKSQHFTLHCKVDMVFIDGDHRFDSCYADILRASNLLTPSGLMCGHDYGHPLWTGVEDSINALGLKVEVVDTIWWTRNF